MIHPTPHTVTVLAELLNLEFGGPAVVHERPHRCARPLRVVFKSVDKLRHDRIVAIGEHVGFDNHAIAHDALNRKPSAVDIWLDVFNNDAATAISRRCIRRCGV